MSEARAQVVEEVDVKREVQAFYDSVGWMAVGEGLYQNARYEDLRPVTREYIRRCHLRVGRHLPSTGRRLLDAGSGPVQYPEYLEYSRGFARRVCLDISLRALTEARVRLGDHGVYVVGDLASLPFQPAAFEGVVSLHALHHLPAEEHQRGLEEMYRVLRPQRKAVVVYAWGDGGLLMRLLEWPTRWVLRRLRRGRAVVDADSASVTLGPGGAPIRPAKATHTYKHNYRWAVAALSTLPGSEICVWRTVNTGFLRAFIHPRFLGGLWLRMLYAWEELTPHLLGRIGQYPMFTFSKPALSKPGVMREGNGVD